MNVGALVNSRGSSAANCNWAQPHLVKIERRLVDIRDRQLPFDRQAQSLARDSCHRAMPRVQWMKGPRKYHPA